ncbi:FMN-dependent NADH-azoreductase [Flavobacterium bizetiae]|uniref:FMN-dependent NADH-azoreductase n=1 Tax=Flavobacterium bizetiae TaxID=2704140 RepID=A0A6J4GE87_9FLAO|nr:NAD(P)H-dependent oxidoreductase [Flavobacterium bizetiae]CAA9196609.1 FMN-dependent NADH-azoreductase [Flavobacterium bizetiae]CAD5340807.1 FMN-dependent NADH-azoreductase [Flavobacterium bizetiae]CAD5346965.1 FMN-dependent NADH-azoreductase [Flavobacterium bizetiae]
MKNLIVYAHPNSGSLNHFFKRTVLLSLQKSGAEIKVRDLNQINFNPVLSLDDMNGQRMGKVADDVKKEQDFITWADRIIFIYPIWWTGMPAIMKGYIDRVFSYGFAYRYDQGIQKGLLTGKKTIIINSHGKSNAEYEAMGMDKALALTSDTGIFTYSGLEIQEHFYFDKADRASQENVSDWENQLKAAFKIGDRESLLK